MQERKLIPVEPDRNMEKWAVIVGISEYKYQPWNLNYADRDAEELYKLLLTDNGSNFKSENIYKLVNEEATTENIRDALFDFLHKPKINDLVILYFACHGTPNLKISKDKKLYLLTHNTKPDKIAATALKMEEINNALRDILEAEKVIILADTCHSGGINYRDINNIENRSINDNSDQVTRYLQQLNNSKGGIAIVTSAEATQLSQEGKQWGGGHGVFTHFILEGMRGKADENNDGIVTAGELFEYVRENVKRETNSKQIPFIDANRFDRSLPVAITEIKTFIPKKEEKVSELVENENLGTSNNPEEEYRVAVTGFLEEDPRLEDPVHKILLEQKANELNLTEPQAHQIQQIELNKTLQAEKKIEENQQQYLTVLEQYIAKGQYPFNEFIENRLKRLQKVLKLSDPEVAEISQTILEQAEVDYRIKSRIIKPFSFQVITVNDKGENNSSITKEARFFSEYLGNGVQLEMVVIPGGEFLMGTTEEEIEKLVSRYKKEYFRREQPQHLVNIKPFFMGKYPVTQAQWQAIMGNNPARFTDNILNPVENVSWDDAKQFCQKLSQQTGTKYRLPSEAEWEYAARAGTNTPFYFGATITGKLANYNTNNQYAAEATEESQEKTTKVGIFPPNDFGLYDMHGNVWEWCEDDWHENYNGAPNDNRAWLSSKSSKNVARGGSWRINPGGCRSAYRDSLTRDDRNDRIGFRVVCVAFRTT